MPLELLRRMKCERVASDNAAEAIFDHYDAPVRAYEIHLFRSAIKLDQGKSGDFA